MKYPCGKCYKPVAKNHRAIYCEVGNQWWQLKCYTDYISAYGGGIAAYVRPDLPCDRKKILEFKNIESICIEILVGNTKMVNFRFLQTTNNK